MMRMVVMVKIGDSLIDELMTYMRLAREIGSFSLVPPAALWLLFHDGS